MQHKPLTGIRVLELGSYISLPYAGALLSALGADVVKVERPEVGEDFRRRANDKSPFFIQYNAGKRSLSVDLKRPEGVELVKALVPRFDVVLENLRPGKLAALGLGPDVLAGLRPDLIHGSVNGFGEGGPLAHRPAYDTIGQSFSGLYSILGEPGSAQLSGTIFADLISGFTTLTGVLAALVGRGRSGAGVRVDTSIMEAVSTLTADALTQYHDTGAAPHRQSRHPQAQNFCVATASGESIAIHLSSSEKFWGNFCDAMGRPDLKTDPRFSVYRLREDNYFALVPIVEAEFAKRTAEEWDKLLSEFDVPFAPVLTMATWTTHPQVQWLDLLEPTPDDGMALLRPPWRFDGVRPDRGGVTPRVGQHTREVAAEVYAAAEIDALIEAGVLFADA
ncbi:CoA transferase [Actinocorallia sp. API 0066]|uniref:CaiB/BaiF CoA transferase family protein n=1 Tax=Actinocorallia sp. API 0066 TaxID=2896846 RepID=UPI001E616DB7|nr:CoA transferase [Actinocorallia sp. API 0066]MCD0449119.1 CoA transferase [Actinocorallia sp. API 0066]